MGFDDIDLAEQFILPLTTIRQDQIMIGEIAARMLMSRLLSSDDVELEHAAVLPVSIVLRGSTGAPAQ